MQLFMQHASSKKHRGGYVKRCAHLDTHIGGIANGGSPRFYVKSAMPGPRVVLPDVMLPRAGIQGGTYPSKESAVRSIGALQDLVGATLFFLGDRKSTRLNSSH